MKVTQGFSSAIAALIALAIAPAASAAFFFSQVSNNGQADVASQFVLDVVDRSDLGAGVVGLKVSNTGPTASTIAEFHIDDVGGLFSAYHGGSSDGSPAYGNSAGVAMGPPPPGNANLADKPTGWSTDYFATADQSPAVNGVDPGEMFELRLVLAGGKTLADVSTAFGSLDLRAGIHVISIDDAGSETYVTDPNIPTPGSLALGFAGLVCTVRRRR